MSAAQNTNAVPRRRRADPPRRNPDSSALPTITLDDREKSLCVHCLSPAGRATVRRALRVLETNAVYRSVFLMNPSTVREYLRLKLAGLEHESFIAIWTDTQHGVVAFEEVSRGSLWQAPVYPRELVKAGLRHNASAVFIAHNHPSGCARPSQEDKDLISTLERALALVGIRVLDHFVIAGDTAYSFAEHGLMRG